VLDCEVCGNPRGGRHAKTCTPQARHEHALRQIAGRSAEGKAGEVDALSGTISALSWQIIELTALRDDICRETWGGTFDEVMT
jgi:hypothetical protein